MKLDKAASYHYDTKNEQRRFSCTTPRPPPATADMQIVRPFGSGDFRTQLLSHIPQLRGFARGLTGKRAQSDDLVQDALLRALAGEHRFEPGTNMRAWLFTILRNCHMNEYRRRRFDGGAVEDLPEARLSIPGNQEAAIELKEVQRLMLAIPVNLREALILVSAAELTYKDASVVCGCAVGTIKSRVNRARTELARLIDKPTIRRPNPMPTRHSAQPAV
jgi:RNA polymerase sigma-70 factor, ECF subfamily